MLPSLTQFRIEGLHGLNRNIDVSVSDNRLVLVGENGTGKSTVANLLYYTLTQQWRRVMDFKFAALQVTASEATVRLSHEDIETLLSHERGPFSPEMRRRYPLHMLREAYSIVTHEVVLLERHEDEIVERISEMSGFPKSLARRLATDIREGGLGKLPKELLQQIKRLTSWDFGQFLYLPTYRRIEQDLKSIFGSEIEEKVREFRVRFKTKQRSAFIELVEFGMEDVEKTIQARMAQIKESVRTGLSTLTGTYLREVIRGLQDNPDVSILRSIDPNAFHSMFARIDEAILPSTDKKLLESKIAEISTGYDIGPQDRVIAHFLSKLVTLYKRQQEDETDVREFVQLCNGYLTGKMFVYDDIKYEVYVKGISGQEQDASNEEQRLELKVLSSGEKQIVSLFSHMCLSGERRFFVVIDEPELSLSVPWQKKFLPDILKTGKCTGVVAVTHSPFIWDNELQPYVKSLAEFIEPVNALVH